MAYHSPDDNDDDALTEFNFRVKGNISWKSFAIFKRGDLSPYLLLQEFSLS